MNLFRLMKTVALLVVAAVGLAACGQKGPLILPPKNTAPRVVAPIILPGEGESKDNADDAVAPADDSEVVSQPAGSSQVIIEERPAQTAPAEDTNTYRAVERESDETPLGILPHTTRHGGATQAKAATAAPRKATANRKTTTMHRKTQKRTKR